MLAIVTGAGRGLGLELARQLRERGYTVLAPDRAALDVTDAESVRKFAATVAGPIDLLINNAGIALWEGTPEAAAKLYDTNTLGAMRVTDALAPLLAPDARIVMVGSATTQQRDLPMAVAPYAMSKAALDMLAICYGHLLRPRKVMCLCPGGVKTDMNPDSNVKVEDAARGFLDRVFSA